MGLTDTQRDWLTLSMVPGVGTTLFIRLLARFGAPRAVLSASEAALAEVVGPKLAQRIRQYKTVVDVEAQERRMAKYGAGLITMDDPAYPPALAEIYDPPLVLWTRGALLEQDAHAVAIVGTRRPTPYGLRMAESLARGLAARGVAIVSGLAAGIDAAAHRGALEAGGRTLAVLGCGVDIVYPSENAELMHHVIQQGAVLSPYPMGVKPSKGRFPDRNRFISGLSLGLIVVEAPPGSGALITARNAAEQGREVFAIPGHVGERNSMGPHSLLREGARLAESADDVLAELALPVDIRQEAAEAPPATTAPTQESAPPPAPERPQTAPETARAKPQPSLAGTEKDVLSVLSPDGSFVDEIAMACRISVSEALSSLTMLELKGLVRQFSGKRFAPR